MKKKLLNLLFGETAGKRGVGGGREDEAKELMRRQIKKMTSMNQELISVRAVRQ